MKEYTEKDIQTIVGGICVIVAILLVLASWIPSCAVSSLGW